MNTAAINRAIAESLGWKQYDAGPWYGKWYLPLDDGQTLDYEANFTDSLDACRLFEKTLNTEKEKVFYLQRLSMVQIRTGVAKGTLAEVKDHLAFATSLQRCEAYLRMKGLWKEEWRV